MRGGGEGGSGREGKGGRKGEREGERGRERERTSGPLQSVRVFCSWFF